MNNSNNSNASRWLSSLRMMMVMVIMSMIIEGVVGREDNADYDPFNCAAQQYSGECCMPGALPLVLPITQCSPGFYCPWINDTSNPANVITACPPTPSCQLQRLASGFCPAPQGKHEPVLCLVCIH
jgi:hypothetical protein